MNPTTDAAPAKPRLALAIATSLGLGYLPKAPGTWGSLMGVALARVALVPNHTPRVYGGWWDAAAPSALWWSYFARAELFFALAVSAVGVWAAGRVATYLRSEDPQIVVVDEVAGQLIAYFGLATPRTYSLNWKYLLLGFILFRVFDIWKPFPARQAEFLPGGLGIMADDWVAGVYAALVLGLARYVGF